VLVAGLAGEAQARRLALGDDARLDRPDLAPAGEVQQRVGAGEAGELLEVLDGGEDELDFAIAVGGEGAVYLILDGILDAEVGGELVGEVGPGAIVGERGVLEGKRTATLTARTKASLVSFDAEAVDAGALASISADRRREGTDSADA